jgi:DNA-binding MarR family transcriptional regulator
MSDKVIALHERIDRLEMAFKNGGGHASGVRCVCGGQNGGAGTSLLTAALEERAGAAMGDMPELSADEAAPASQAQLIEVLIASRQLRSRFFDEDLFFDPAWSILIDLYRADLQGANLSVSAVCIGSGVPETTALRYIRLMEQRGLLQRIADQNDRRRFFIKLSPDAFDKLSRYFDKVRVHWVAQPLSQSGRAIRTLAANRAIP